MSLLLRLRKMIPWSFNCPHQWCICVFVYEMRGGPTSKGSPLKGDFSLISNSEYIQSTQSECWSSGDTLLMVSIPIFLLQYGESPLFEIDLFFSGIESKHFQTPKAQRTQSSEYFDSFNTFSSKQKLQQGLKSWSNFGLVLFGKGHDIRRTTLTNPRNNFYQSM